MKLLKGQYLSDFPYHYNKIRGSIRILLPTKVHRELQVDLLNYPLMNPRDLACIDDLCLIKVALIGVTGNSQKIRGTNYSYYFIEFVIWQTLHICSSAVKVMAKMK